MDRTSHVPAASDDPVSEKPAHDHRIEEAVACAQIPGSERQTVKPPVFRDPRESRLRL